MTCIKNTKKTPLLFGATSNITPSSCDGLVLLVAELERLLKAPGGAAKAAGAAAAVLMLYAMFGGLWRDEGEYDAFCDEFSTDLCGEISRGRPKTKQSSVVRTALSPLEILCKYVYGPAETLRRAPP